MRLVPRACADGHFSSAMTVVKPTAALCGPGRNTGAAVGFPALWTESEPWHRLAISSVGSTDFGTLVRNYGTRIFS